MALAPLVRRRGAQTSQIRAFLNQALGDWDHYQRQPIVQGYFFPGTTARRNGLKLSLPLRNHCARISAIEQGCPAPSFR